MHPDVKILVAEAAIRDAKTMEEFGEATRAYIDVYMERYGGLPELRDFQSRYWHVAKRITGDTSAASAITKAVVANPNYPIIIVRPKSDSKSKSYISPNYTVLEGEAGGETRSVEVMESDQDLDTGQATEDTEEITIETLFD